MPAFPMLKEAPLVRSQNCAVAVQEASLSISKFSQQALWQEALQVLAELPADMADVPVINAALTACGRASQRLKVCDLLQTIKRLGA